MTLTDFLLARIAEDEAVASASVTTTAFESIRPWELLAGSGSDMPGAVLAEPARVLAECDAKRRIVTALASREDPYAGLTAAEDRGATWALRQSCTILASIYADHPDYDEAWRP